MKELKIEYLGHLLREAYDKKQPQPIFFLGAGASRSGNIPLAKEITEKILRDYADNPFIKDLPKEERASYAKLMSCLLPDQRKKLLKDYIENAKINVTHIYLAQLMCKGYVDYVLTVNFDNLMLRALALYNVFPSTYDMAILKELTTSKFPKQSVVYLHGQHHGLWLLNTPEEMEKVKNTVPGIFHSIKDQRPWVFIGYSGDDPIFDHIKDLGRFDNGLYWIAYNTSDPNKKVRDFLAFPHTNAFIIKGYDADSFMIKLNNELGLPQPVIIDKPFTSLKNTLNEIVDIDEQEYFKEVKERLRIVQRQVEEAIQLFETGKTVDQAGIDENKIDLLKKEIINLISSERYEEDVILKIEKKSTENPDDEVKRLLAALYSNWGWHLGNLAKTKEGQEVETLYQKAIEKCRKATEIQPNYPKAYNSWGINLGNLAQIKEGAEAEDLYQQAFNKYHKATEIKPDFHEAYYNWGNSLMRLAQTKKEMELEILCQQAIDKYRMATEIKSDFYEAYHNWAISLENIAQIKKEPEADNLYQQAFDKYRMAIEITPDFYEAYNSWGNSLTAWAKTKKGPEVDNLYQQAFDKYRMSIEIMPDFYETYNSWGNGLGELAKTKQGPEADNFYRQSFDKYSQAITIKPDYHEAYHNWGSSLWNMAKTKEGPEAEVLYQQVIDKYRKAIEFNGYCYNLACLYAVRGNVLAAMHYLDRSLSRAEVDVHLVENDEDWRSFLNHPTFVEILEKYR